MKEYLDVIDDNGNLTGEIVDRKIAHEKGIRHQSSHIWFVRKKDGEIEILLQKRSADKESFPGCYDISSAGHLSSGEDFETAAVREVKEELGISIKKEDLIFCGDRNIVWDGEFNGNPFHDRQHSKVFIVWYDAEKETFQVDHEEVESVKWISFKKCMENVKNNSFSHCIAMEEMQILKNILKDEN